jgi:hypothetical protein
MRLRLRQVALVARDLAATERELGRALGATVCYRDPQVGVFGLANVLFRVGEQFIEVVSPVQADTTAGRLLDKRGGDSGYMVIVQTDDLDQMRARIAAAQARVVFEAVAAGVTGLHLHPRDVGGAILSIDRSERWEDWPWAGPSWQQHDRAAHAGEILGVVIQANDPAAMARRWSQVLGRAAEDGAIALDQGVIRFEPVDDDRGEGLSAIELRATGPAPRELEICGCRLRDLSC